MTGLTVYLIRKHMHYAGFFTRIEGDCLIGYSISAWFWDNEDEELSVEVTLRSLNAYNAFRAGMFYQKWHPEAWEKLLEYRP